MCTRTSGSKEEDIELYMQVMAVLLCFLYYHKDIMTIVTLIEISMYTLFALRPRY